ncbi:glycine--tRNA ligase subunit beta [Sphingomonas sp. ID1715]|uniref:glycine--tRNA ligase subunit beta n=1 Tax=Sphingomonas sp. ID1715 TaxID=1656898 RepID=UPI0014880620|nr:glycine--tRNA ligase subunit beta [Sphingomonas sp. ID1715]
MTDFLLELLSEEIPARMQARARDDLARLFAAEIAKAGLKAAAIETFSTPRRLALIARDLPAETEAVREELKGPRTSAPPQALEGFLRKTGLTQDQLTDRDGVYFAVIDKPGRATAAVLAEAIPAIVRAFPWPKSMRWGAASQSTESLRWVRPLQGIIALLGEEIVPFEIDGIASGAATVGHRFHHPGRITIGSAEDYAAKLRACHVIVDHEERESIIAEGATTVAAQAGLTLVRDEALLAENAGLTEWPVPLLGSFDASFLEVPPEVIQLTMATNQKYFACLDAGGKLVPNFICTANVEPRDRGVAIVAGNQKVLAARLSDAKFFWEQDLKVPLQDQLPKLEKIVFHEKLGTVADKVERVAKLARWLVEEGIVKSSPEQRSGEGDHAQHGGGARSEAEGAASARSAAGPSTGSAGPPPLRVAGEDQELADLAEQAARLCKADLVTGMVGEFPELQGVMGGYYARAQGLPPQVADAIRDHYKPVGQGDEVPTAPVTVAVSLADKLDTIIGFFGIKERPTGSRDPFALRRAALSSIQLILDNRVRVSLERLVASALRGFVRERFHYDMPDVEYEEASTWLKNLDVGELIVDAIPDFFADRLKVQQREAGVRHDLIDAVFALGGEDDLVRLLARVKALQSFIETAEGRDLLAGYKRAANILKKEAWPPSSPAQAGAQGEAVRGNPGLLLSQENGGGDVQGIPQTGEEDPFVMAEDLRDAISAHEKILSYTPEPEESSLIAALDSAEPRARAAVAAEDFEGAMAALASLRAPVDAFFDKVTVNDADPARRAARLNLLARMRDAVHQVADFSRIEG